MNRPHFSGLLKRIIVLGAIGGAIIWTGKIDAARYTYENTIIPEESIPKLDRQTYIFLNEYGTRLQDLSYTYGVDWRLALAVLRQESGFDPQATSYKGASGFMQLMPVTGLQIASLYNVDDLSDPIENIRLGIIHLRDMLRNYSDCEGYDRLEFAAAAYNSGIGRIQDAQTIAEFLGDKPTHWSAVGSALPLLSTRYSPIHKHIWKDGKPSSGTFGGYEETLTYVENVMRYYNIYKNVLHE